MKVLKNISITRKQLIVLLAGLGGLALLIVLLVLTQGNKDSNNTSSNINNKACELLSNETSQKFLDRSMQKTANENSTKDIEVSRCKYAEADQKDRGQRVAALTVERAKNDAGKETNKNKISERKESHLQRLKVYGENSFWDPVSGQLWALSNGNLYIFEYGTPIDPTERTYESTQELFDLVYSKISLENARSQ